MSWEPVGVTTIEEEWAWRLFDGHIEILSKPWTCGEPGCVSHPPQCPVCANHVAVGCDDYCAYLASMRACGIAD